MSQLQQRLERYDRRSGYRIAGVSVVQLVIGLWARNAGGDTLSAGLFLLGTLLMVAAVLQIIGAIVLILARK